MMILDQIYSYLKKWSQEVVVARIEKEQPLLTYENIYYGIEEILSFERAMRFCYEILQMLTHNRTVRHQYNSFTQWSLNHEEELKRIMEDFSSGTVKFEKDHQVYTLPTDELSIESVVNLGLVVAGYRLNIYKELRDSLPLKNRILLNHFIAHVSDEIKFLQREKEMSSIDQILYHLN